MGLEGNEASPQGAAVEASESLRILRFRNYEPIDAELKRYCEDTVDANEIVAEIESTQEALLASVAAKFASPSLDLENMIPKKSNWDLKRAVAPQLRKLEKRTQKALRELQLEAVQRRRNDTDQEASGRILAQTVAHVELPESDDDDDLRV